MAKAFIDDTNLTNIANAIRSKNGTNNTYLPSQMAAAINAIPVEIEEKEVNFYDYEGTLVASYTKEEALALTALPTLPDRTSENLTNEGWNMTIADIAERINKGMHYVSVGCIYHTTDNKTHMNVIPNYGCPIVHLYITPSIANDTTVYWGDGSSDTISSTSATQLSHTYNSNLFDRELDLIIESTTGLHTFKTYMGGSESNNVANYITKIFYSNKARFSGTYIHTSMHYLEYATVHSDIIKDISTPNSLQYWFSYCYVLKHINLPNVVVGNGAVAGCGMLKRASIPIANSGYYLFRECYNLDKCETLFGRGITANDNTSIAYMYYSDVKVKHAFIDERITQTQATSFAYCYNLETVTLPSTLTTINNTQIFYRCFNLREIYIKASSVPVLTGDLVEPNTFYKIFVPRASCAAYKAASNWSTIADHIYPYDF